MADSIGTGGIIGIAAGASAVTALIMSIIYKSQVKPLFPAGPRPVEALDYFSIINWFKILYYFLPYALFLFGVIYDGLVRKIKFFPAGFIGLIAVYINSFGSWATGGNYENTDICGIPGMTKWGSDVAPSNIVFVSSVLSYIAAYITNSQSDSSYSGSAWAGVFLVSILQGIMFNLNGCDKKPGWAFTWGNPIAAKFVPPIIGLMSGLLWGGLSGYLISKHVTGDTAGVGLSSEAKQSLGGPAMGSTSGTPGVGKCSSTDSDDQFVCEAYKNGELVTSTIVE